MFPLREISCFSSLLLVFVISISSSKAHLLKSCGIDRIYNVGDSLSDTGNLIREVPVGINTNFARTPYGKTFFHYPTGRCSDGLLIIDYIALSAGLQPLPPYKLMGVDFKNGVNFAVAGATALPSETLEAEGLSMSQVTNSSLSIQMDWLLQHLRFTSLYDTQQLSNTLFVLGEIGGNDYNFAFFHGKNMTLITNVVPQVIKTIVSATRKLIDIGALRILIPGNLPIGCIPAYTKLFKSTSPSAYDQNKCLKTFNSFAEYHNKLLLDAIARLRHENPNVTIVYGDYYNAYQHLLQVANLNGYETQVPCCGGDYNSKIARCGNKDAKLCSNPYKYLSWDGLHLTQKAYQIMAVWLINDIFPKLKCDDAKLVKPGRSSNVVNEAFMK